MRNSPNGGIWPIYNMGRFVYHFGFDDVDLNGHHNCGNYCHKKIGILTVLTIWTQY